MLRFILLLGFGTLHSQMISIHLMLRFIHNFSSFMRFVLIFQYISCYGLSLPYDHHYSWLFHFNTSHVTVYPDICKRRGHHRAFQYISCYGLSLVQASVNLYLQLFQYISCYGLSWDKSDNSEHFYDFNTSHVTVYQKLMPCGTGTDCHFNTSHVTVYHFSESRSNISNHISIHLMLRFIRTLYCNAPGIGEFQYISCYGLSWKTCRIWR